MKIEGGAKRGRGRAQKGVCGVGGARVLEGRARRCGFVMATGSTSAEDDVHS